MGVISCNKIMRENKSSQNKSESTVGWELFYVHSMRRNIQEEGDITGEKRVGRVVLLPMPATSEYDRPYERMKRSQGEQGEKQGRGEMCVLYLSSRYC